MGHLPEHVLVAELAATRRRRTSSRAATPTSCRQLGAKKIAVVGTNVASGAIFLNQVAQAVQKTKGLKLVYKTTDVTPEQQDFTGIAAQRSRTAARTACTRRSPASRRTALSEALKQAGVKLKAIVFPGGYDDRVLSLPGYDGAYFGIEFKPLEVGLARRSRSTRTR